MRNLGKVYHEHFVSNRLTQRDRQLHLGFLELLGVQCALHAHNLRVGVRHLDTDGTLARDRSNDTDAERRKTQGDIIFQVLDLGDADALGRLNLIEGDGRTHGGTDGLDLYAEVAEHLDDSVLVGALLLLVDGNAVVLIFLQEIEGRVFVSCKRFLRIDRRIEHLGTADCISRCLFVRGSHGDIHVERLAGSSSLRLLIFLLGSCRTQLTLLFQERKWFSGSLCIGLLFSSILLTVGSISRFIGLSLPVLLAYRL